ncbi:MAG: hypothetical protein A2821_04505 [Candidatus Magasanikbacteria bacterium RIFCSPHIGHO2_01_FULL_41_23]|uniref:ABC transporter substrate-binding protein n=1 Tax=Candidatus Magasanikbacteria bacterium RIFCSPLOWO2_01_FULL_40_15 TaxID=1798686 RepID=A0A1F6N4Z3_9BACT|nr:MAG: hypothetical protein A2821_04505 [Candidatus Magasanikbacteria bacterium RIFCSPHIGHO2_01_FULL_41_23]OGH67187.1 MAG: hypothetical protein A3C66_02820 [Candidatus Magasanikbacteria bacterium RIFCSPHIGHO2_02_FULL_41_35]OGH75448.1 MAG: hypothetical protein A3F22_01325 [Candidatus Magasanikbacteria bacterium RIFCSPHIGHO2_12_FULL_41_16]OGH78723.1 MAG: hypothetical protein A2983_04460 [Candidatus Magasanikbacteria bacterium RIFCSPLOWO2_01_FULL_40_15]
MYKKITIIIVIILGLALAAVFASRSKVNNFVPKSAKISVTASFYPLAYFAEQVGGDRVSIQSITPNGTEPHDFEPTPQDIITLRSSRVFFYNGNGVDAWADRVQPELIVGGVKVVAVSDAVSLMPTPVEQMVDDEREDKRIFNQFDPHIWLDPIRARQIAELIRDTLIVVDPSGADYYRGQFSDLSGRLTALDTDYTKSLASCATRDVIVSHYAFNYVAERYNLKLYAIAGMSPEAEPSAKHLAELTRLVKEKNITTIFFETLVSPRLAETLAKETGAVTNVLNPIEGLTSEDLSAGKNYETIMRDNLSALTTAMLCQ